MRKPLFLKFDQDQRQPFVRLVSGVRLGYTNFDHFRLRILVKCAPNPT
jgi:hypothetical protein